MYYVNKKGNRVGLTLKRHAVLTFCDRYERLFGKPISCQDAVLYIKYHFPHAHKVTNLNGKELKRIKLYGPTFYFRDKNFTYVVQDVFIITIEISKSGFRYLNQVL